MQRRKDEYTVRIRRGVAFIKVFKILNPNQSPVNITGWNPVLTIKPDIGNELSFDTGSGHITLDALNGKITISINQATVDSYTWTKGKWNLASRISGVKEHIYSGLVEIINLYE